MDDDPWLDRVPDAELSDAFRTADELDGTPW